MKAAVRSTYGPPDILAIKEIEIPVPKDNELLVRVHASTVNRTDCGILWGKPAILRIVTGLTRPRLAVTGSDFAGEVVSIGKNVRSFQAGDKVMGFNGVTGLSSHAEYLAVSEGKGVLGIPRNLSYEQAVACVEGAFYAVSGIKRLNPVAGQKALVNGATGAIGSSMVQVLKFYGVHVTAVCGGENSGLVTELGADKIIDYKTSDFTTDGGLYDFVFDAVGKSSFARCKRLLTKKGIYSSTDGFENLFLALFTRMTGGKKVVFAPPADVNGGLNFIRQLVESGNFRPVIDRKYSLDEIVAAYKYVATGQKIGNVIITMDA